MPARARVLVVAGSDSGGGAGILAYIKTVTALGGYAATAVTALTAQNTEGVFAVHDVPADFVARQMAVVLDDIGADAIKTGMLHRPEVIDVVGDICRRRPDGVGLVVDPVMVAKGGASLLEPEADRALVEALVAQADLVTPNLPEAERLTGVSIHAPDAMEAAGRRILDLGAKAVLVKGGHLAGTRIVDLLVTADEVRSFESTRIETRHTHGTGCTLASAIATGLAQKLSLADAVARARDYVAAAIRGAPGLGRGHGPLDHGHPLAPRQPVS
ncbi:MAG: bifunctional hydroxymethylpyrimidine kinase/phosphomethylpyrimidine kinase [Alphaproteobacteria bacterium]|nr:bifunctional hydroxymethylpyrimidine kinase/phosphomethylpyrimidine kinase [Alphaproteobacteria bacterium]